MCLVPFDFVSVKCKYCEKTYSTASGCVQHMKVHEETKYAYECYIGDCAKGFTRESLLRRHIRNVHFGFKQYVCKVCRKGYTKKRHLVHHVVKYHATVKDVEAAMKKLPLSG